MRLAMCLAAAFAMAGSAAAAPAADCKLRMEAIAKEHKDFFTTQNAAFLNNQPVLRDLRNAAVRLQVQGLENACMTVVTAMEEAVDAYRTQAAKRDGDTETVVEPEQAAESAERAPQDDGRERSRALPKDRAERNRIGGGGSDELAVRAVPLLERDVLRDTSEVEGADVHNLQGQLLGEAEGLLLKNGTATHLVVDHGGFWNLEQRRTAVPAGIVRWDPKHSQLLVPLSAEEMDGAPAYDREDASWTMEVNDRFYAGKGG